MEKASRVSDKSVRDCRQSARKKENYIIVSEYLGRYKQHEYKIKIEDWKNISKYGNYEYNKFEYLSKVAKYDIHCCNNLRILESQIKAIDKLMKSYKL